MITLPQRSRSVRWLVILYGFLIFFWSAFEDNHIWPVSLLGTGLSALLIGLWIVNKFGGQTLNQWQILLLGALGGGMIGIGASIATVLLMLFKNARHAHLFPDFPAGLMGAILTRTPVWAWAGALVGLGLGFVALAIDNQRENSS